MKVENLGVENTSLRSEINRLKEDSEKLKVENSSLLVQKLPTLDPSVQPAISLISSCLLKARAELAHHTSRDA